MSTDLIRKASIEEIVDHRARALELYRRGAELLQEALKAAALACPSYPYHTPERSAFERLGSIGSRTAEGFAADARRKLDAAIWRHCMKATHLSQVMDAKAREDFSKQIEKDPPEANIDNLSATLLNLLGNSEQIFKRGVVEAFKQFDPNRYQRSDAFKIEKRVACRNAFTAQVGPYVGTRYWNSYAHVDDHLRDIERVFAVMDGKPIPEYSGGIVGVINGKRPKEAEAENAYFHCRMYKNGALHICFKRTDLLQRVNLIIAEHYGAALADAS